MKNLFKYTLNLILFVGCSEALAADQGETVCGAAHKTYLMLDSVSCCSAEGRQNSLGLESLEGSFSMDKTDNGDDVPPPQGTQPNAECANQGMMVESISEEKLEKDNMDAPFHPQETELHDHEDHTREGLLKEQRLFKGLRAPYSNAAACLKEKGLLILNAYPLIRYHLRTNQPNLPDLSMYPDNSSFSDAQIKSWGEALDIFMAKDVEI